MRTEPTAEAVRLAHLEMATPERKCEHRTLENSRLAHNRVECLDCGETLWGFWSPRHLSATLRAFNKR